LLHIHDIFTPYDYPKEWIVGEKRFWNEQYIFESFIAFNAAFQIECPIFYMSRTGALRELSVQINSPVLSGGSGAAIWLKRIQ
jgi:hypothetical protein